MSEPDLPSRLRVDLKQALRDRDPAAVSALRTALAALANAEAPAFDAAVHREGRSELVEHRRIELGPADWQRVLVSEVERRLELVREHAGRVDDAYGAELDAEVVVLRRYLG